MIDEQLPVNSSTHFILWLWIFTFSEPIGFKAPTFSSETKLSWFVKKASQNFALLCPAQAYPIPSFK